MAVIWVRCHEQNPWAKGEREFQAKSLQETGNYTPREEALTTTKDWFVPFAAHSELSNKHTNNF